MSLPVILIFDIGKTHKKYLLFNNSYELVDEATVTIPEVSDEDGYPCDDIKGISNWVLDVFTTLSRKKNYVIHAVNFATYGASLVHLDKDFQLLTPLYNYLKPIDKTVCETFYAKFGAKNYFSKETGSPILNMLNSGIQFHWLKHARLSVFESIRHSLHLPQYLNFLFTKKLHADVTSIGCHTGLWNIQEANYHSWLEEDGVDKWLPIPEHFSGADQIKINNVVFYIGIGLHDSSAALLPYVFGCHEPFILLSTGTWNIAMNIFSDIKLGWKEYCRDCLYYLLDTKRPVVASRLFLGYENEYQVKKLEAYFGMLPGYARSVKFDAGLLTKALDQNTSEKTFIPEKMGDTGPFPGLAGNGIEYDLFDSFEEAYHKLMLDHCYLQLCSIRLVTKKSKIKKLVIEGGFINNLIFLEILQHFIPEWEIFTSDKKNGAALGAAVAIHNSWNDLPLPGNLVKLNRYVSDNYFPKIEHYFLNF